MVLDLEQTRKAIDGLIEAADAEAPRQLRRRLELIVPEYTAWIEEDDRATANAPATRRSRSRLTGAGPAGEASMPSSA